MCVSISSLHRWFTFVHLSCSYLIRLTRTFSSFRSIPEYYYPSTERRFTASACTATMVGLLPSFVQHLLTFILRLVIHGTPRAKVGGKTLKRAKKFMSVEMYKMIRVICNPYFSFPSNLRYPFSESITIHKGSNKNKFGWTIFKQ